MTDEPFCLSHSSRLPAAAGISVATVGGVFLAIGICEVVSALWRGVNPLWESSWALLGIIVTAVGCAIFLARTRITVETDPAERMVRVHGRVSGSGKTEAYRYEDVAEICMTTDSGEDGPMYHGIDIVGNDGKHHPTHCTFRDRRQAIEHAEGLADAIGCRCYTTPFPFTVPVARMAIVFGVGILPLAIYVAAGVAGMVQANRPPGKIVGVAVEFMAPVVLAILTVIMVLVIRSRVGGGRLSVALETDPTRRVLTLVPIRTLGLRKRRMAYDAIAAVAVEAHEPDSPGRSYGVSLVCEDGRWEDLGYRAQDRDQVRSTAERLARRIGRPVVESGA